MSVGVNDEKNNIPKHGAQFVYKQLSCSVLLCYTNTKPLLGFHSRFDLNVSTGTHNDNLFHN